MGVNVCVYVGEGLRRSFAKPNPFVLTHKICLNQITFIICCQFKGMFLTLFSSPDSNGVAPSDSVDT